MGLVLVSGPPQERLLSSIQRDVFAGSRVRGPTTLHYKIRRSGLLLELLSFQGNILKGRLGRQLPTSISLKRALHHLTLVALNPRVFSVPTDWELPASCLHSVTARGRESASSSDEGPHPPPGAS